MPRVRFKLWFEKRWKISSVAHPRNNLFGQPEATKPCGNCLQSLTKLCATSLLVLSHCSFRPTLFTSVHFLFLHLSLSFSLPRVNQQYEKPPLSNAFKFEIQIVHLATSYLVYPTHSLELSYMYNVWKKSFICIFPYIIFCVRTFKSFDLIDFSKEIKSEGNCWYAFQEYIHLFIIFLYYFLFGFVTYFCNVNFSF